MAHSLGLTGMDQTASISGLQKRSRTSQIEDLTSGSEFAIIPASTDHVLHVPSGRQVPISKFVKMLPGEVQEKVKPPPQPIKLIANDLCVNGGKPRELVLDASLDFTGMLEFLKNEYKTKVLFEYQDRGGVMTLVDDDFRWERFCQAADDAAVMTGKPAMNVYMRAWKYKEPQLDTSNADLYGNPVEPEDDEEEKQRKLAVSKEWHTGLFSCFAQDVSDVLCFGLCLPFSFATTVSRDLGVDPKIGCTTFWLSPLNATYITRHRYRQVYGIDGDAKEDMLSALCCRCCAAMQMAQDLRVRGEAVRGKGVNWDSRKWHATLFGCMDWEGGLRACLLSACCGPCEYASQRTFEGDQAWWTNCCCYSRATGPYRRGLIRARLGIEGKPLDDCAVHCLCSSCAMAQELLELQVASGARKAPKKKVKKKADDDDEDGKHEDDEEEEEEEDEEEEEEEEEAAKAQAEGVGGGEGEGGEGGGGGGGKSGPGPAAAPSIRRGLMPKPKGPPSTTYPKHQWSMYT